jgi:phage baseplate assembly protein W
MIDGGALIGRGISFPPRIGSDGRLQWSEGSANVREAIRVILSTEQNERLMLPEFGGGLQSFLFEPNTASTRLLVQDRITTALQEWEPRIRLDSVTVEADPTEPRRAIATLQYRLITTDARERISVGITLGP